MAQYVFPKVEPADIQRSRRDLSLPKFFTTTTGVAVPILSVDMLPADWMRINTLATVTSLPMIAPVKGRWKCSFDYYYNPWSNIYGFMDNNRKLTTEQIVNNNRWCFSIGSAETTSSFSDIIKGKKVPCGGVLDFLGCPIGYSGKISRNSSSGNYVRNTTYHPAESLVTYVDIIRNYYVNNQENVAKFVRATNAFDASLNRIGYWYGDFALSDMDSCFDELRYRSRNGLSGVSLLGSISQFLPYFNATMGLNEDGNYVVDGQNPYDVKYLCGLFLRSYRMDLLRGIMNSSVGSYSASFDTSAGFATMDNVFFANKLQDFINRIDITGGRFSDWMRTRWNIDPGLQVDRPIYLGSHSLWLNTVDVIATASGQNNVDANNNTSSLGQQVSYRVGKLSVGEGRNRQRPITIKSKQYGTLMCIFSIVPDVVYSQGFELNMLKTKFADIYDPAFKQLGFQDVLRGELNSHPTFQLEIGSASAPSFVFESNSLTDVVGKRVAWSEYMASLPRVHGDFAYGMSLDYWVNNRVYAATENVTNDIDGGSTSDLAFWRESELKRLFYTFDVTTYIYPHLWNSPFADKSIFARNWTVDCYFQIDANRSLGKRLMPHL